MRETASWLGSDAQADVWTAQIDFRCYGNNATR